MPIHWDTLIIHFNTEKKKLGQESQKWRREYVRGYCLCPFIRTSWCTWTLEMEAWSRSEGKCISGVIAFANSLGHPDIFAHRKMQAWSRITEAKEKVCKGLLIVPIHWDTLMYLNTGQWRLGQESQKQRRKYLRIYYLLYTWTLENGDLSKNHRK